MNAITCRILLLTATAVPFALSAAVQSVTVGAVYTMTNDATANQVVAFPRYGDGTLGPGTWYHTGGRGTGSGLGSQSAVILSPNAQFLFAADAGSNTITSFQVTSDGLVRIASHPSLGTMPVSLAMNGNLLFVLNQGSDSIQGFVVNAGGSLTPIAGGSAALSGTGVGAAQIGFNTQGNILIVTEKNTNLVDTLLVGANGKPVMMKANPAPGQTPFGFTVGPRNTLYVTEAFGGGAGMGKVSSYHMNADGSLTVLSASVSSTQSAACWIILVNGGRLAVTANTGGATLSTFNVGFNGGIALNTAVEAATATGAIDLAVSDDSHYLYSLQNGGAIGGFGIMLDGSLTPLAGGAVGLPTTVTGLAAR